MKHLPTLIPSLSSNSLRLAVLLASVGGFLDAYSFISRNGVFANAQTGNMVLMAVKAASGDWEGSMLHIPSILAFILGVVVAQSAKLPRFREVLYSYRRSILILEVIILVCVGFMGRGVPDIIVTAMISFVSSLQISTFNKIHNWAYNSTMTTGNLRTAVQAAFLAMTERNQEAKEQAKGFSYIILAFIAGAIAGTFSTTNFGYKAVWIACLFLFISMLAYHKDKGYFRRKGNEE